MASTNSTLKRTKELDTFVKDVKLDKPGTYSWEDKKWFDGNVLDYSYKCDQCDNSSNAKVSFRSHNEG